MAVYPFSPGNTADPALDAIAVELDAMQAIARALAAVRDPHIRQRVMQWGNERFNIAPAPQRPGGRPGTSENVDESSLDVEPLYGFFDAPRPARRSSPAQAAPTPVANAAASPLADSLYDFFEHPRAAAQSLAVRPATAVIAPAPAAVVAPPRELRAMPDPREPREETALEMMVKGFASELQRLADEWQTA
jgi:hypothetical protein